MIHCFTSFTFSYLSRALILARTMRAAHPDWVFWALLVDECPPGFNFDQVAPEFDRVIYPEALEFDRFLPWIFRHDIVEACTAVKGQMLRYLLTEQGATKAIYIDPDIAVFHPLDNILRALDDYAVVLTPHQTEPEVGESAIRDNEITSLKYGTFNLGFVAVRNCETGRKFADWWASRLYLACYDDIPNGIFTDQRWCDLVPSLFDGVFIERDPGCNLASWNLSKRQLRIAPDGSILVNGSPLKFYHFTKINSAGDTATEKYAGENTEVYEIWNWYKRALAGNDFTDIPGGYWHYSEFSNKVKIPRAARLLLRDRSDLFEYFEDPFEVSGDSYFNWIKRERPDIIADKR